MKFVSANKPICVPHEIPTYTALLQQIHHPPLRTRDVTSRRHPFLPTLIKQIAAIIAVMTFLFGLWFGSQCIRHRDQATPTTTRKSRRRHGASPRRLKAIATEEERTDEGERINLFDQLDFTWSPSFVEPCARRLIELATSGAATPRIKMPSLVIVRLCWIDGMRSLITMQAAL